MPNPTSVWWYLFSLFWINRSAGTSIFLWISKKELFVWSKLVSPSSIEIFGLVKLYIWASSGLLIIEFELFEERHKVVLDAFDKSSNLPDKGVVPVATWLVSRWRLLPLWWDRWNKLWNVVLMGELIELFLDLFISFNRLPVIIFRNEELSSLIVLLVSKNKSGFRLLWFLGNFNFLAILNLLPLTLLLDSDGDVDSRSVFGELSSSLEEGWTEMLDDDLFLVNSLDKALLVLVVELVRFDENEVFVFSFLKVLKSTLAICELDGAPCTFVDVEAFDCLNIDESRDSWLGTSDIVQYKANLLNKVSWWLPSLALSLWVVQIVEF